MKIKSIAINNFKGIKSLTYVPGNKTVALIGANGLGKTSFLEAVRFALTGSAPDNCISDGADETTVSVILDDGNEFSRTKYLSKPTKIRVNRRNTTAKNLEELLLTITGLSESALKVVTSKEVLTGLKPSEFGDFIMGYIPEKLDFDTVCSYIPGITSDCRDELAIALPGMPNKFGIEEIKSAQEYLVEERKMINREVGIRKSKLSILFDAPFRSAKEVNDEMANLMKIEGGIEASKTASRLYEDALARNEAAKKRIRDTEADIAAIKVSKPNPSDLDKILGKKAVANNAIIGAEKLRQTLANDIELFENTLENLDKPVCPLSDKLVCTTDKSNLKEEFLDIIAANKEGLAMQDDIIETAKAKIISLEKDEADYRNQDSKYKEKIMLHKRLDDLQKNIPIVPDKPATIADSADLKPRIAELQKERDDIMRYQQQKKDIAELEKLQKRYETLNYLCKATQPKGPVMDEITSHYLSVFESVINESAKKLRVGFVVKFVSDDGIVFLVQTDPGKSFRPYEALSNGEKTLAAFLLLDMLNSLCGSKLLLLDDMNHLDKTSFNEIFALVMSPEVQDAYDHIFLCSVDNPDIVATVKSGKSIDFIY